MSLTFTPTNDLVPKHPTEKNNISYRILTVFEKTLELDELSIPTNDENRETQRPEDVIGVEFPLIKINDYIFSRDEIRSVTIDTTEFVPKITLDVGLLGQSFLAKEMPKDGDIISVAIRNKTDLLKIVRNDYIIIGVNVVHNYTEVKSPVFMTFYGDLFVPGLSGQGENYSFEGTSLETLKDYAAKIKLGFATNESNTDDKQVWIKGNMSSFNFIHSVAERAWKDDSSFYKCWIDVYYNLNFVNMNKVLMSSETEVDVAAMISNVDTQTHYGLDAEAKDTPLFPKVFSTFPNFRNTPFFITSWRPINKSSSITFKYGSRLVCSMFEHNNGLYERPDTVKYWNIKVDPTYDPEKTNKMIILRGRSTYVEDENNTDLKRANYDYINLYEKRPWLGIQYTISDTNKNPKQWDGNHHKNYQLAKVKNLLNLKELDKLNVHIYVNGNNFNIIKGDKVPIALIRIDIVDNMFINPDTGFKDALDLFYSGWYLIKGFILSWNSHNKDSTFSNYTQEIVLTRREWPTPIPVDPIKVVEE